MAQQILQFNQAQLQLLDMMSFVKTPEALSDLNKAISDYFVKKADEEMEKCGMKGLSTKRKLKTSARCMSAPLITNHYCR